MNVARIRTLPALAFLALGTSLASAAVIESFETLPLVVRNSAGDPPSNPPYTNVAQSTVAGVTHGTYSLFAGFTNSDWSWMYKAVASGGVTNAYYGTATYFQWYRHKTLKIDLHRPALTWGWNLEFALAMNGVMGWQQNQLVPWLWLNPGESSSQTLTWDYSAIRDTVGPSGGPWQLALMARNNVAGGGMVYVDNLRFEDLVQAIGFAFPTDLQGWVPQVWGTALAANYWDATDAQTNAASGSMYCFCDFANATTNQTAVFQAWNFSPETRDYAKLSFDVKVDAANSVLTSGADYGGVQVVLRGNDINWNPVGTFNIPATAANAFVHFEVPLYQPLSTNMAGINLIFGGTNFQGAVWYYVDNIMLLTETNPPTVILDHALPGLELSAASNTTDQRQSVRTANGNYNWTSAAGAVTYSMTINEGLSAQEAGMMAYLFLVGTTNSNPGATGDWDESNGIFLELRQQSNGLCSAALLFKTNAPGSNGIRYTPSGTLAVVSNIPMVGTWSLTLNQANFGLSTPGGGSTNASLPTGVVGQFSTNVFAYFGVQPNQTANLGRYVDLSRVQISGVSSPVDQVFTSQSSLNTSVLVASAANAAGVQMRPTSIMYRLSWPAPPSDYTLQSASAVDGIWASPGLPAIIAGSRNITFLPSTALPSTGAGFFRLQKQ